MSIKYKSREMGQPGVVGGGVKKHYAAIVYSGEAGIDELVKEIEKFCSLTEPDIRGVIIALENAIQGKMANGQIVRLDKLGSFYPAISSKGELTALEVNAQSIRGISINYRPGDRLLKTMTDAGFEKLS